MPIVLLSFVTIVYYGYFEFELREHAMHFKKWWKFSQGYVISLQKMMKYGKLSQGYGFLVVGRSIFWGTTT